ncbi:MAG: hypothetical protein K2W96_06985 [Gemmataceae bacterium]|nr:hypothetical protein [Gemmataceae bacterium]
MARPLSPVEAPRGTGSHYGYAPSRHPDLAELDHLRAENEQLRQLCGDLEQALQESAGQGADAAAYEERLREYEALLEGKDETIRALHQQAQEAVAALEEAQARPAAPAKGGPLPRENELLSLSEDLERERRQLQEDEQALMEQMRQMEMTMARERAEMARQRNDLQRLSGEIRHELERLERNGALQSKMDDLKAKLQDATNRRGAAPAQSPPSSRPQTPPPAEQPAPSRGSFMGRLFGGK